MRAVLSQLSADYPIGVEMEVLNFQPDDVVKLVDDFVSNLLQAVAIVMLTMILFMGLRTGLVVATLIPTASAAAEIRPFETKFILLITFLPESSSAP